MDWLVSHVRVGRENTLHPGYSNCSTAARLLRSATDLHPTTGKGNKEDNVYMSDSAVRVEWLEWVVSYLWCRQSNQNHTVSKVKSFLRCFLAATARGRWIPWYSAVTRCRRHSWRKTIENKRTKDEENNENNRFVRQCFIVSCTVSSIPEEAL